MLKSLGYSLSIAGMLLLGGGPLVRSTPQSVRAPGAFSAPDADDLRDRLPEEVASIRLASVRTERRITDGESLVLTKTFPAAPARVTVPVHFHVFYKKDGTGYNGKHADGSTYPLADRINDQITELNRTFSNKEMKKSPPQDARIDFTLHGVEYVENDDDYDNCDPLKVMKGHAVTPDRVLNVYTCSYELLVGSTGMPGSLICSRTQNPWDPSDPSCGAAVVAPPDHYVYGIRIDSEAITGGSRAGLNVGDVLTHEVGHFFGLLHPYEDSCAPGGPSDGIDDTPRMRNMVQGACPASRPDTWSCSAADRAKWSRNDYLGNYMDSTYDACRNHFTNGQVRFMQASMADNKNFF